GGMSAPIVDVRTVGVPVTDQQRALAFYVDTLGFEKRLDVPFGDAKRWIEVAPAGGTQGRPPDPPPEGGRAGGGTGGPAHDARRRCGVRRPPDARRRRGRGVAMAGRAADVRLP